MHRLTLIPTVHMGVAATQMERKGIPTERGNQNREISRLNQILFVIIAKLKQFRSWLKGTPVPATITPTAQPVSSTAVTPAAPTPPTFASILQSFLQGGKLHNQYGKIRDLKAAALVFAFMEEHGISKMSELRNKVDEIFEKASSMSDKLEAGKIRSAAEQIARDLNRPQQQQHKTKDRGTGR